MSRSSDTPPGAMPQPDRRDGRAPRGDLSFSASPGPTNGGRSSKAARCSGRRSRRPLATRRAAGCSRPARSFCARPTRMSLSDSTWRSSAPAGPSPAGGAGVPGRATLAAGTLLLDVPSDDVIRHSAEPLAVPGPYECHPYDMGVTGRDIRVADGAYSNGRMPRRVRPSWTPGPVPRRPRASRSARRLLAQFTGHMSIAADLRPHAAVSQRQASARSPWRSTGSTCPSKAPRMPLRMLFHHASTFAGAGTTHAENRVYDLNARCRLVPVHATARPLPSDAVGPMDVRTARASPRAAGR